MFFRMVKNLDRSFFRFVTIHACDRRTDGRTDRQTEFSSLYRVCIACSAVMKNAESRRADEINLSSFQRQGDAYRDERFVNFFHRDWWSSKEEQINVLIDWLILFRYLAISIALSMHQCINSSFFNARNDTQAGREAVS